MRIFGKISGLSRAGWLIAGLVIGLIVAPAAAVAATFMVLHGANGAAVNATNDNQLLTAEAPPSTWVGEYGWADAPGVCSNLPVVSKTRGFVVKQINTDVFSATAGNSVVYLYRGPGCHSADTIGEADGDGNNVVTPFDPGVALPKGGQISILYNGPANQVRVQVLGYTVPAADAPSYTPVLLCTTALSACGS